MVDGSLMTNPASYPFSMRSIFLMKIRNKSMADNLKLLAY